MNNSSKKMMIILLAAVLAIGVLSVMPADESDAADVNFSIVDGVGDGTTTFGWSQIGSTDGLTPSTLNNRILFAGGTPVVTIVTATSPLTLQKIAFTAGSEGKVIGTAATYTNVAIVSNTYLTIDNLKISSDVGFADHATIWFTSSSHLIVMNTCSIINTSTVAGTYGIYTQSDLTIRGTGTLIAKGFTAGMRIAGATTSTAITLDISGDVTAIGTGGSASHAGISIMGDAVITNTLTGKLVATAENTNGSGICTEGVKLSIIRVSVNELSLDIYGIGTGAGIYVSNTTSSEIAISCPVDIGSSSSGNGIYSSISAANTLTITVTGAGAVKILGNSTGIYMQGNLAIGGSGTGSVSVESANASGIHFTSGASVFKVDKSNLTVTSESTFGVGTNGSLTIDGIAATTFSGRTAGIYFSNDSTLAINNSVTAYGTGSGGGGVSCNGTAVITGTGSLTAGGTGTGNYGIGMRNTCTSLEFGESLTIATTPTGSGPGIQVSNAGNCSIIFNRTADTNINAGPSGQGIYALTGAGNTLTLNNNSTGQVTINSGSSGGAGIYTTGNLSFEGTGQFTLTGTVGGISLRNSTASTLTVNTNVTAATNSTASDCAGVISASAATTITGTGSLTADNNQLGSGMRFTATGATVSITLAGLTVTGGTGGHGIFFPTTGNASLSLNITAAATITGNGDGSGLKCMATTFTLTNSGIPVTFVGGATGKGILAEESVSNLTINGTGAITASGGQAGIHVKNGADLSLTVNATSVTAEATDSGANKAGVVFFTGGNATINGTGGLTAKASGTNGSGILMYGSLTLSVSSLSVDGIGNGHGIYSLSEHGCVITINRNVATLIKGGLSGNGINHDSATDLSPFTLSIINNGFWPVTVEGGSTSGYGIFTDCNLSFGGIGGAIKAVGATGGVYSTNLILTMTVDNGDVTAESTGGGHGIIADGALTITGPGTLSATGGTNGNGIRMNGIFANLFILNESSLITGGGTGAGIYFDGESVTLNLDLNSGASIFGGADGSGMTFNGLYTHTIKNDGFDVTFQGGATLGYGIFAPDCTELIFDGKGIINAYGVNAPGIDAAGDIQLLDEVYLAVVGGNAYAFSLPQGSMIRFESDKAWLHAGNGDPIDDEVLYLKQVEYLPWYFDSNNAYIIDGHGAAQIITAVVPNGAGESIRVFDPGHHISTEAGALTSGLTSASYSEQIVAWDGSSYVIDDFRISLITGSLPPGLSISSTGEITGTPTAGGTFYFIVEAQGTDTVPWSYWSPGILYSIEIECSIIIDNPALEVSPESVVIGSTPAITIDNTVSAGDFPLEVRVTMDGILLVEGPADDFTYDPDTGTVTIIKTVDGEIVIGTAYSISFNGPDYTVDPTRADYNNNPTLIAVENIADPAKHPYNVKVVMNGVTLSAPGDYSYDNITGKVTLDVPVDGNIVISEVKAPGGASYIIVATADSGGKISPAGKVIVPAGTSKTFVFEATAGKVITGVKVDGVLVNIDATKGTYTFSNVVSAHTIEVVTRDAKTVGFYIEIVEGKGKVEYNVNGGAFTEYLKGTGVIENSTLVIRAVSDNGYTFVKWVQGSDAFDKNEITLTVEGSPISLNLYFEEDGSDFPWLLVMIILFLILLFLVGLIMFLRRKKS